MDLLQGLFFLFLPLVALGAVRLILTLRDLVARQRFTLEGVAR